MILQLNLRILRVEFSLRGSHYLSNRMTRTCEVQCKTSEPASTSQTRDLIGNVTTDSGAFPDNAQEPEMSILVA